MKKNPFRTIPDILAIAAGVLAVGIVFVYITTAFAFVGPGQTPPNGNGAIGSDSSNNVSIGTSTTVSGTKLLVVGASSDNTTYAAQFWASNLTPIFLLRSDGSVSIETSTISAGNTVIGGNLTVGGTFVASTLTGTMSAGNISSGQFGSNTGGGNYSFSGNVGIGTTGPGAKLQVGNGVGDQTVVVSGGNSAGTDGANITMQNGSTAVSLGTINSIVGGNAGTNEGYLQVNGGGGFRIGALSGPINFAVNSWGNTVMQVATSGNVGIGTTAPSQKLEVVGNVSSTGLCLNGVCNTTWPNNSQWTSTGTAIYYNGGNVGIGTAAPITNLQVSQASGNAANGISTIDSSGHLAGIYLDANGHTTIYNSNASGYSINFAGSGSNGSVGLNPVDIASLGVNMFGANNYYGFSGLFGTEQFAFSSANSVNFFANGGYGESFFANGNRTTPSLVVASSSNIGIGTTSPAYTLDVNGAGNFNGYQIHNVGTPTSPSDVATKSYVDSSFVANGGISGSGSANYVPLFTGTNSLGNSAIYQSGGNVGIGTTAPGTTFDVETTANVYSTAIGGNGGTSIVALGNRNGTPSINAYTTGFGAQTNLALNPDGGNVGIGTTAPSAPLSIQGPDFNTQQLLVTNYDTTSGTSYFSVNGSAGTPYTEMQRWTGSGSNYNGTRIYSDSSGDLLFDSTSGGGGAIGSQTFVQHMVIAGGGNVGIGTTAPAYTLDVNGTGNFTQPVYVGTAVAGGQAVNVNYLNSALASQVGGGSLNGNFATLTVTGTSTLSGPWSITGLAQADLQMNGHNVMNVGTLQVTTIDPSYQIGGTNYDTFAPSIAGVQDEVTGNGTLTKSGSDYEYVIDFPKLTQGSDLWVWYQTVDFSKNTVEAIATPYGQFAEIYYTMSGSTLTFHGNAPARFSFRLTGKRFDWQKWPTRSANQNETPGFVLPVKN